MSDTIYFNTTGTCSSTLLGAKLPLQPYWWILVLFGSLLLCPSLPRASTVTLSYWAWAEWLTRCVVTVTATVYDSTAVSLAGVRGRSTVSQFHDGAAGRPDAELMNTLYSVLLGPARQFRRLPISSRI